MDLIRSHGLEHVQVPQMGLNLILSDSGLRIFTLPVPALAFPDLGGLAGELAIDGRGTEVIENLSLLHVQGSQVSRFLPERAHIIPGLSFVGNIPMEALPIVLDIPGQTQL